tara:strand:+ start:4307 stop:5182 length:876 start_codon:yes stop_codon:yes gene_type:complete
MGYNYTGEQGLRTKADFSRQIYQNTCTTATMSGSTNMCDNLRVGWYSANTYNFTVSATTGSTLVMAINQQPNLNTWASSVQINPNQIPTADNLDLQLNTTTGEVTKHSSSLRYKHDVRPLPFSSYSKLLQLEPKKFKWNHDRQESIGLIAEEVDALGLTDFVNYDIDGRPDGVKYKLLAVGLIGVLKNGLLDGWTGGDTTKEQVVKITTTDYTTSDEDYVIVKGEGTTITLIGNEGYKVYIKSMVECVVTTNSSLIDDTWESLELGPESCIELLFTKNSWYILSSDGIKNS